VLINTACVCACTSDPRLLQCGDESDLLMLRVCLWETGSASWLCCSTHSHTIDLQLDSLTNSRSQTHTLTHTHTANTPNTHTGASSRSATALIILLVSAVFVCVVRGFFFCSTLQMKSIRETDGRGVCVYERERETNRDRVQVVNPRRMRDESVCSIFYSTQLCAAPVGFA